MSQFENIFTDEVLARHSVSHNSIECIKSYLNIIESPNLSNSLFNFITNYEKQTTVLQEIFKFYSQCETTMQKMVVLNSFSFCTVSAGVKMEEFENIKQSFQPVYKYESILFGLHLFLYGFEFKISEQYENAIALFKQSKELLPKFALNYREIGNCYHKTKRFHDSLENLKIAIDLDPESQRSCLYLGQLYISLEQYDIAIEYFNTGMCIEKYDNGPEIMDLFLYDTSSCYRKLKNYEAALQCLNKMKDRSLVEDCAIANCLYRIEQYERAIEKYEILVHGVCSKDFIIHYWLGLCYYDIEKYDEAIVTLQKSIDLGNTDSDCNYYIAICKQYAKIGNREKRHREAIQLFEKLHKQEPSNSSEYLFRIGYSLLKIGETEEALSVLKRSIELDPTFSSPMFLIGSILVSQYSYKKALDYFMRAHKVVKIEKQKEEIERNIILCCSRLNRKVESYSYAGKFRNFNGIAKSRRKLMKKSKDLLFLD